MTRAEPLSLNPALNATRSDASVVARHPEDSSVDETLFAGGNVTPFPSRSAGAVFDYGLTARELASRC